MARAFAGTHVAGLRLTQLLAAEISLTSRLTDAEIEQVLGLGAEDHNGVKTGRTFGRYRNGQRAMTVDQRQQVTRQALRRGWIRPEHGLELDAAGKSRKGPLMRPHPLTELATAATGQPLSDLVRDLRKEQQAFASAREALLDAIKLFASVPLKHGSLYRVGDDIDHTGDRTAYADDVDRSTLERTLAAMVSEVQIGFFDQQALAEHYRISGTNLAQSEPEIQSKRVQSSRKKSSKTKGIDVQSDLTSKP